MAEDKKFNLKGTINLPQKKELKKSGVLEEKKADKAVQNLHSAKGKVVRISLDIPEDMYPELKIGQVRKGYKTTREYLLDLLRKDLGL